MATTKIKVTRNQLAQFLKDPKAIKQFENAFSSVSDLDTELQLIINEPSIGGNTAPVDSINYIDFSTGATFSQKEKRIGWNNTVGTLLAGMLNGVNQDVGFSIYAKVKYTGAGTVTKGSVVGKVGVSAGSSINVDKYNANESFESGDVLGLAANDIATGNTGYCCIYGIISGIDTSAIGLAGNRLYASSTAGAFTDNRLASPNNEIDIGICMVKDATNGAVFVNIIKKDERSWGRFIKENIQIAAVINTPTPIVLTAYGLKRNINWDIANPTRITFSKKGLYKVSATVQFGIGGIITDVYLWLRQGGADISQSTRYIQVQNEASEITLDTFVEITTALDYIELVFAVSDLSVFLSSVTAIGFCPDAPAVIVNITQVQ